MIDASQITGNALRNLSQVQLRPKPCVYVDRTVARRVIPRIQQLLQRHQQKEVKTSARLDAHAITSEGDCELAVCQIGLSM